MWNRIVPALAVLGVAGFGWAVWDASHRPPRPSAAPAVTTPARPALPSPPQAAPVASAPALPPLPETELKTVPVHTIPGEGPGPGDRHVSAEVALGASRVPSPSAPRRFSGSATATGPAALQVGDVPVQLFGIKPPAAADRCGMAGPCLAAAQRALAGKIAGQAKVSCQVPQPKPGLVVAFAICLDPQGTDLGGFLVSEGLALADTGQTYDYAGAESAARSARRGLWGSR